MKYPYIFIASALLILISMQGQAASFPCHKATTEVEKMICADKELSRLDDILDNIYRREYQGHINTDRKHFEKEQAHWLHSKRNACKTPACIRDAYYSRIATLDQIDERHIKDWKYPPYPEIWGHEFPNSETCQLTTSGTWFAPNGDLLIRYAHCPDKSTKNNTTTQADSITPKAYSYREFFSQQNHVISIDEFNDFHKKFASAGSPRLPFGASKVRFKNGNVLSVYGSSTSGCVSPYSANYELTDKDNKIIWNKAIIKKIIPRRVSCNYPGSVDYQITYDVTSPRMSLLRDDTLLLSIDNIFARFNSDFSTPYPYDKKHIYIVDYEAVQGVIERAKKRCDPFEPCLDEEMNKYLNSLQ